MARSFVNTSALLSFCAVLALSVPVSAKTLSPQNAWLVGPLAANQAAQSSPSCVMSTEFNNGFYMNFTGDGKELNSLRVDFRQPSFKTGREYDVSFVFPPETTASIKGKAYNTAGLEFDLSGQPDIAAMMAESEAVFMKVGNTVVPFSLAGIGQGMARLRNCAGDHVQNIQPAAGSASLRHHKAAAANKDLTVPRALAKDGEIIISVPKMAAEKAKASAVPQQLDAKAMESELADIEPTAGVTPAAEVIAEAKDDVMEAVPVQEIEPISIAAVQEDIYWNVPAQETDSRVWQALQGLSLRETLTGWCRREGVELIWDSEKDFSIRNTIRIDSDYEVAVERILNQFSSETQRPFGQLHVDSTSGIKVLVIRDQKQI